MIVQGCKSLCTAGTNVSGRSGRFRIWICDAPPAMRGREDVDRHKFQDSEIGIG